MPEAAVPPAEPRRAATAAADEEPEHSELTTFRCNECYVYKIPPASTVGHRAELWDVDNWLQEVSAAVVTCQDDCWVRLCDQATGELFAECPIPNDKPLITGTYAGANGALHVIIHASSMVLLGSRDVASLRPVAQVVEPVVDSSRYFVLRIADQASGRHAFIGVGFRQRAHASDFCAALDDHLQYLRRKREAEKMREEYAAAAAASGQASGSNGAGGPAAGPARDLSLKPGETIRVALPMRAASPAAASPGARLSSMAAAKARFNFFGSPAQLAAGAGGDAAGPEAGVAPPSLLPPPPPPRVRTAQSPRQVSGPAAAGRWGGGADGAAAPGEGSMAVSPRHADAESCEAAARLDPANGDDVGAQEGGGARSDGIAAAAARFASRVDSSAGGGGLRSMRVSMAVDDDAASEAASSLANLSMKAHTSGSNSAAGSVGAGSDGGWDVPAGDMAAGEADADDEGSGAGGGKDDWGDFVS